MRIPPHEATTAQLGAAYPLAASRQLPAGGVLVGRDLHGGVFVHDPFELYASGALTNPNMLVLGQIGRGKSALVKTYLYRQAAFGRRIVVLDPKGEYAPLAEALGVVPLALRPGGSLRLNPLDPASAREPARGPWREPPDREPRSARCDAGPARPATGDEAGRRRLELLAAIGAAALGRPLAPAEHAGVELALDEVARRRPPTIPAVVEALLSPSPEAAASVATGAEALSSATRDLALELRRLVRGELRGMFDGPTSPEVDLGGDVVVLDLSALYHSPALGVIVTCAAGALQSLVESGRSGRTLLVVDEAWAVLSNLAVARWFQASWKLARARGVANVAVVHRVSDLAAVGSAGSEPARIAEGLAADSETIVCYAQPPAELPGAAAVLGLSPSETRLVGALRRGVALWRVAGRSFLVEHRLSPAERALVDTDAPLLGR